MAIYHPKSQNCSIIGIDIGVFLHWWFYILYFYTWCWIEEDRSVSPITITSAFMYLHRRVLVLPQKQTLMSQSGHTPSTFSHTVTVNCQPKLSFGLYIRWTHKHLCPDDMLSVCMCMFAQEKEPFEAHTAQRPGRQSENFTGTRDKIALNPEVQGKSNLCSICSGTTY